MFCFDLFHKQDNLENVYPIKCKCVHFCSQAFHIGHCNFSTFRNFFPYMRCSCIDYRPMHYEIIVLTYRQNSLFGFPYIPSLPYVWLLSCFEKDAFVSSESFSHILAYALLNT